jgi:hypothetical protein
MTRSRDCPCGNCEGDTYEVKDCNTQCCRKLSNIFTLSNILQLICLKLPRTANTVLRESTTEPRSPLFAVTSEMTNVHSTWAMGCVLELQNSFLNFLFQRKCFCDNYCAREESDCCPDYAQSCLNVHPTALPPPVYTTREPCRNSTTSESMCDSDA